MITSLFPFPGRRDDQLSTLHCNMEAEGDGNINLQWIFENIKDGLNAVFFSKDLS